MRRSPLLWLSLASVAVAAGSYGCQAPESFHLVDDGGLLANSTGGVAAPPTGTGGGSGTGGTFATGGAIGSGGFTPATGGTVATGTGGTGGRASTGGTDGSGHGGTTSGGAAGHATGGAIATGGTSSGGVIGTGGQAQGGGVGTGGSGPGTGGNGGHGAAGGDPGSGGSAGGSVGTGPCAGLCAPATDFHFDTGTSYHSPQLGTTAICYQVTTALTIQGGGCSNCTSRIIKIDGKTVSSTAQWGTSDIPAKVNGGYCFQLTAGSPDFTQFFTF